MWKIIHGAVTLVLILLHVPTSYFQGYQQMLLELSRPWLNIPKICLPYMRIHMSGQALQGKRCNQSVPTLAYLYTSSMQSLTSEN